MSNQTPTSSSSPSWSTYTKIIAGVTVLVIIGALLIQFRGIIGPLLLALILAFLLHPLATRLSRVTKLSWRASVGIIYIIVMILILGLLVYAGFQIVTQLQSLVELVQNFLAQLPELIDQLANSDTRIGPFVLRDLINEQSLNNLTEQLLGYIEPILSRAGGMVGSLATGALGFLGWLLFIVVISYFVLNGSSQVSRELLPLDVEVPGYQGDIRRLSRELNRIWDAFLRGQLIIFMLVVIAYLALLYILGVRFSFGIALMAGLARFVPYLGPFATWTVTTMVTLFQGENNFGLDTWQFTLLVVIACIVLDQIFDNLVVPRFFNNTLGVHPAALLIAALVAARMIGIIGLVLAAPVLATLNLVGRYVLRKMLDQDPWPPGERPVKPIELPWIRLARQVRAWWRTRKPK